MSDTVTAIMEAAGRYPVLSHGRQLELAKRVRRWLDWDASQGPCPTSIEATGRRAKSKLLETNLRLVISQAARYRHVWEQSPDLYSDLIQEGVFGLNRAIEKFDPTRGYAISTYSIPWIRQTIGRSIPYLTDTIRRPGGVHEDQKKLARLISSYEAQHGTRPSMEWLIEQSGLSKSRINTAVVIGHVRLVSLDQPIRDPSGDGSTLGDLIPCQGSPSPEEAIAQQQRIDVAHELIDTLSERDRTIITSIYLEGALHKDCAKAFDVSTSAIGLWKLSALEKMRAAAGPAEPEIPSAICTVCQQSFTPIVRNRTTQRICSAACRAQRRRDDQARRKQLQRLSA